jgi:hypothetical protein
MKKIILSLALAFIAMTAFTQSPTITSFIPASGSVGSLVTITGTNLNSPTAFTIGGVPAIIVSDNGTTLVGLVMPGAGTGSVSVTTAGGSCTSIGAFTITRTPFPSAQQGNKLVPWSTGFAAQQGSSVSISADGNTAIIGAPALTAAWAYTRSGTTWTLQGSLSGTGNIGVTRQGQSVALSADGNTAIIGGPADSSNTGAAWIFTRSGSTWTQQGSKLVGTGVIGSNGSGQGSSVSLSADGNTAIVGGDGDNLNAGAAWVFTRSGTTWTQQGSKLVGTGAINGFIGALQGASVSLSADGNTAIVGGFRDNNYRGAAWLYKRSGTTWAQQGSKLVGTGAVGTGVAGGAEQGASVSLSADGNTALVGGPGDDTVVGAVWVYWRIS